MCFHVHNYLNMYISCGIVHVLYISCGIVHVFVCTSCLQVYDWLTECGWVFLRANAFIGSNASEAQSLIQQHDVFEGEAKVKTSLPHHHIHVLHLTHEFQKKHI